MKDDRPGAFLYISVILVSAAMLGYEVTLTRWLSISQWSHFAYLVISIALLGIAAAGTAVALSRRLKNLTSASVITYASLAAAVLIPIAYLLTRALPFDEVRLAWDRWQWLYVGLYYVWLGLPFFASALVFAHLFTRHSDVADRIYFYNLAGAAIGCLGVLPLLNRFPPNVALKWMAVTYLVAALVSSLSLAQKKLASAFVILIIALALIPTHLIIPSTQMSPYKALPLSLSFPESSHLVSRPHSQGQLDVVSSSLARFAPGLSLSFEHSIPKQLGLTTDGDRMNAITSFDGRADALKFIEDLPASWIYKASDIDSALIIEPGGGLDVLTALHFKTKSIDAVQNHPELTLIVDDEFGDFSGRIYSKPNVSFSAMEPRAFLGSSRKRWNAIILSQAQSPSATSTGMYGITENYLFTTEAFTEYLNHLTKDGWLCVTRYLLPPPREGVRIVSVAAEALKELGVKNPSEHILAFRTWGTITVGVKRSPITPADIESVRRFLSERQFDFIYYPGMKESEANLYNVFTEPFYYRLISQLLTTDNLDEFYNKNIFDLKPVTDERPFFFFFFPFRNVSEIARTVHGKWQALLEGGYLVYAVLFQAIIISFIIVILPLLITRFRDLKSAVWIKGTIYFTMIGLGYMLIELVFIQYGIRFLGSSTYAVSLVIAALLLSSGVGSLISRRMRTRNRFAISIASLCILIVIASKLLPYIMMRVGGDMWFTGTILFVSILPFGLLMGLPFPIGVSWLGETNAAVIPWGFAFNGAASVIGAVLAVVLALGIGFSNVLFVGAGLYLLAGLLISSSSGF